jgi:hypothetical protein
MIETRSFCDCYGCLENCNTNGKNDSQWPIPQFIVSKSCLIKKGLTWNIGYL